MSDSSQNNSSSTASAIFAGGAVILATVIYNVAVAPSIAASLAPIEPFQFQVYCPLDELHTAGDLFTLLTSTGINDSVTTTQLTTASQQDDIDQYVIFVQLRKPTNDSEYGQFYYCSYVRDWDAEDCSQARVVCSSPGPMFYIAKDQKIDVAWVYDIHTEDGVVIDDNVATHNCYYPHNTEPSHCVMKNKAEGQRLCTYLQPTNYNYSTSETSNISIGLQTIPFTVHVHGLQTRPTFDGHPLTWLSKNGNVGLGFQSLHDDTYYRLFSSYKPTELHILTNTSLYAKINRYDNFQPAGSIWYHDHSMHVTWANVRNGMAGSYIIYDKAVEKDLPSGKYDLALLATSDYAETVPTPDKVVQEIKNGAQSIKVTHTIPPVKFVSKGGLEFERNQTYRIRILNGHFESVFLGMTFVTECTFNRLQDLKFADCKKKLNFSVIGSDGTTFNSPIHNVSSLDMYSAERYDILIVFDGQNGDQAINPIDPAETSVYLITTDNNLIINTVLRKEFPLKPSVGANNAPFPDQINSIDVPFYDLRKIDKPCQSGYELSPNTSTTCISARRFKPFMADSILSQNMAINGHYLFESGATDHPRIGTTQDWFFVNLMLNPEFPHPVHIHLINFQIISRGELKRTPPSPKLFHVCSYYEIDYYVAAGALKGNHPYPQLCDRIRSFNFKDQNLKKILSNAFREDQPTKGTDYGFDLFAKMSPAQRTFNRYFYPECPNSPYKYICNSSLPIAPQDQRWKDTTKMPINNFVQIRIRWASTDYDPAVKAYPFFRVPEDELIEFPGYVYHCHFLGHEDSEMMRSIALKPSFFFDQYYKPEEGSALDECMKRKGLKNSDGWSARYECFNEQLSCPAA